MRFLEADHQRTKFRQAQPFRHLSAQHSALGIGSDGAALSGNHETNVEPSSLARCRKLNSARWARVCVMPCRSSRASMSFRPRDNCERSRRPSGANGGAAGRPLGLVRSVLRPLISAQPQAWRNGLLSRSEDAAFAARGFLRSGLNCLATVSQSARSSSLSARLRRGEGGASRIGGRFTTTSADNNSGGCGDGAPSGSA